VKHLYEILKSNNESGVYPYHMPGHKRNMSGALMEPFYHIDITEITNFDNMHQPQGILKELMERAAAIFGGETYLLVNGSTAGILSAVSAVLHKGDTLLMARNCHKSVYHAAYLRECRIEYCYPEYLEEFGICGSVSAEEIGEKLKYNPQIKAVLITSPTYDGIVSDVEKIVRTAHAYQVPVIVDAAHGSHFCLDERFPKDAVSCGADIVIHSIHKTLPALTQTALLHVQGTLVKKERLERFLRIYQTSSPSYILMAGIEQCISVLEDEKKTLADTFFENNKAFENRVQKLKTIKVLSMPEKADPGKKVISVRDMGISGREMQMLLLERYGLEMEMAGADYVLAIMTIMDTKEGFDRLAQALEDIEKDRQAVSLQEQPEKPLDDASEKVYELFEAWDKTVDGILLESSVGEICGDFVEIYPPGIPLMVPGERITKEKVQKLLFYREHGFAIEGLQENNKKIVVIKEEL